MFLSTLILNHKVKVIFLAALLIRGAIFLIVFNDQGVIFQPDSRMYISLAKGIIDYGSFCYVETPEIFDAERTPGYPLFLALLFRIFGENPIAAIMIQILLDAVTCVLIYWLSESLWKGSGLSSGLLAIVNLGMITYAHFILTDTLFLLVFVVFMIFSVKLMRTPHSLYAILTGFFIGIATLIRPVTMYLPFAIFFFLSAYYIFQLKLSIQAVFKKSLWIIVVFVIILSPWLIRNYIHFNRFKLSSQEGEHLLQYIVPFSWQYSKGISFIEGMKKTSEAFNQRAKEEGLSLIHANPFDVSDLQKKMALNYLSNEPIGAIAKAWLLGMAKNLFAPAIVDFSYLLRIERPHFFYTEGVSVLGRVFNFIKGMRGVFSGFLFIGLCLILIIRVLQAWGLYRFLRVKAWEGGMLILVIVYFLLISGPIGYAKYRLPIEPILIILLSIAFNDFYERRQVRQR